MLNTNRVPWKRSGCLVWEPRTTELGSVPLLDTACGDETGTTIPAAAVETEH